jgi:hypothetical protein
MILEIGEKVHVIERRCFAEDVRRHFIGQITRCTESAIRVQGHAWVHDHAKGEYIRKPEQRERVMHLGDRLVINILPGGVKLDELRYLDIPRQGLVVTDGKDFALDINEFKARG